MAICTKVFRHTCMSIDFDQYHVKVQDFLVDENKVFVQLLTSLCCFFGLLELRQVVTEIFKSIQYVTPSFTVVSQKLRVNRTLGFMYNL